MIAVLGHVMSEKLGLFSLRNNLPTLFVPQSDHFKPVDGLRAISILLVLAIHSFWFMSIFDASAVKFFYSSPAWLNWVFNGELGVDIFFVISGFLISSILMREYQDKKKIKLSRFYTRRFMRLMPAYLLAMAFGLVLLPGNQEYVWTNLLYINNLFPAETHFMPWTWSLAIEEQFYFIFPLVLVCSLRLQSKTLLYLMMLLFISSLLIRYTTIASYELSLPICWYPETCEGFHKVIDYIYVKPWARFGSFLPGICVAYLHVFHAGRVKDFLNTHSVFSNVLVSLAVLVVLLVLFIPVNNQTITYSEAFSTIYYTGYRNLFTVAIGIIILMSLYCRFGLSKNISSVLSARIFYPIGQLAYSIYLFHPFVFGIVYAVLYQSGVDLSSWQKIGVVIVVGYPLTFIIAAAVYLFVERPFMRMRELKRAAPSLAVESK